MAELTQQQQQFIDNLIVTIETAEDPESVTNEMVASVFDFLNTGYKRLSTVSPGLTQEIADREAADRALQGTINALNLALAAVQRTAEDAGTAAERNEQAINTLLNGNATTAIESFNEIIAFLEGVRDNDTLVALLNQIRETNDLQDDDINTLQNEMDGVKARITPLENTIKILELDGIDDLVRSGFYYLEIAGNADNVLIVRRTTVNHGPTASRGTLIQYLFSSEGLTFRRGVFVYRNGAETVEWQDWEQVGQKGAGNLINVTELIPKAGGFYTLQSAAEAVPSTYRAEGRWITYQISPDKWETKRFVGSSLSQWETVAAWDDVGGKGDITGIKLNGATVEPDPAGVVNIVLPEVEVDETLDPNSTNPVQNNVIAQKLAELEAKTLDNVDVQISDDETEAHLTFLNKSNAEIAAVDLPLGSGSGGSGEPGQTAKIVLSASVDNPIIREGSPVKLSYFYDHQYLGGDQGGETTGQRAQISIEIRNGAVTTFSTVYNEVARGSYELDITNFIKAGTTDITVKATVVDPETGTSRSRQAAASVQAKTLSLSSGYSLANSIAGGGYGPYDTAIIPFSVSGSGRKTVTLYLDGQEHDTKEITKSGKTNSSFAVAMSGLSVGRHNVQIVAEMEASETLTLVSESVYIDLLKKPAEGYAPAPFIGTMITFPDGRIFTGSNYAQPVIEVGQFEKLAFDFVVYDPETTPATVEIFRDGVKSQERAVARTVQVYTNRYTEYGPEALKFKCGPTEYLFNIEVVESSINLAEVADNSMALKLIAAGRSNSEGNPDTWEYLGVKTDFEGFDWENSGWTGDSLKLINGAKIRINKKLFASDATATGFTFGAELKCSNVVDRAGSVLKCFAEGVGIEMTTEDAKLAVSGAQVLETKFAPDIWLNIVFVVESKAENRLLQIYVNGIRDRAMQYQASASLIHMVPDDVTITSDSADVEIRNIRVYNRALSDDEILANYMVDRPTADEMVLLFERNNVLNDETDEIDIDKLRAQGKAVMRIVGNVDLVNETNNKKFEEIVDVYYYSTYGKEYDFVARNIGLRIQGTSSTTYPRKNYRLYFNRPAAGATLEVNGVNVPDLKYSFKPGSRPVDIFCLKADFSDSSSTHNSGAVRIVNEVFRRCGWLTPPQMAYRGAYDVRIGVDAIPLNLFYDNDGTGVAKFLGKYNFNNEKADSAIVYGFEGIEGFNDEATLNGERNKCICLEFLNNNEALCLFGTSDMSSFDDALEFRFKADTKWADAHQDDKNAVIRLWSWIRSCANNPTKFLSEYQNYFINEAPFAWHNIAYYLMAADNFAKNMMLVTWDGVKWMFIPYDMDTLLGLRNDSYLKFHYTITWDSFDESQNAYCLAGHDSELWKLVRACPDKLAQVARTIRANMSTDYVLQVLNEDFMNQWSERVYNKDGEYKYITPLVEDGRDYLYALQGSRYAHRTYTLVNRFNLLDSEYCAGTYRDDAFPVYFAYNFAADNRVIKIGAAERFCFGYGMTNGDPHVSGVLAEAEDDEVSLRLDQNLIVNDPQNIYGASRIKALDLSNVSHAIVGTLNLNKCLRLTSLNISAGSAQNTLTNLVLEGCRNLGYLNVNNLMALGTLNLAANKKLEIFEGSNTALTNVIFASGGALTSAHLPATIQTLELRYLSRLRASGLVFTGTPAVTRLVVDNCPGIDWQQLLAACPSTTYLRVTGLDLSGRGELLQSLMDMKGVDENGANVNTCRLVGRYQLTKYLEPAQYNALREHFPELDLRQPDWTVIKYDETVSDACNISNLDNATGYDYDNDYRPSAHILAIEAKRHRVMAKCVAPGKMLVCPLDDEDGRRYHDGTEANTKGYTNNIKPDEGDVMMYEPPRWCKGVDDFINKCHYDCFSSLSSVSQPEGVKLYLEDLEIIDQAACRVSASFADFDACRVQFDNYRVLIASVEGYRQVRWPAVNSTVYGAVFLDADNRIVGRAAASSGRMTSESYLFTSVPEGAKKIAFTCERAAAFSFVWLTPSASVDAIEPDAWQTGGYLVGVYKANYGNMQIRSIAGVTPTVSVSQSGFVNYCQNRGQGFTPITYTMHRDIARFFWAMYGNRDSSKQCGYGSGSTTTVTGLTDFLGMKDTISSPQGSIGAAGGFYYDNTNTLRNATSINALGYENLWGNVSEWCAGLDSNYFVCTLQDQGTRQVKSTTLNDSWIIELANGRFMDVIPVVAGGTETTYYGDKVWTSNSPSCVLLGSGVYSFSYNGVACASIYYDASYTNSSYGSRLAFIGEIEYTLNVAAFLDTDPIA